MMQSRIKQQGSSISIAGAVLHVVIVFLVIIGFDVLLIYNIWLK